MVDILRRKRKPPILTPSTIPCLRQLPTINVTQGCTLGCVYCYIQGYPDYPGKDRIVLYENTADLVREELSRRRKKPRRVYFSSSSDAFQNVPEVQEVSLETMRVLLEAGVEVAFLTKGVVGERFIELFARTPQLTFPQVGITTLQGDLSDKIEPNAASPSQRIGGIASLTGGGRMISSSERRSRFEVLQTLGREAGIAISVCRCKNPDLASVGCGIAGPPPPNEHTREEQALLSFLDPARDQEGTQ